MHAIYIDTETGGLFPSIHALLSIGACCNWNAPSFHAYITLESQRLKSVDPEAAEINGYSRELWEELGARPLLEVMPVFLAWIEARKKERPGAVFVCHHLAFDKPFLAEAGRACGTHDLPHRNDWRCSQVLFGDLMDRGLIEAGSSSLKRLQALCGYEGQRSEKHNALQDAIITREGHAWLLHKQREPERTVQHLYDIACQDRRRLENLVCEIADYLNAVSDIDEAGRICRITTEAAAAIRGEKKEPVKPPLILPKPCPCGGITLHIKPNGIGDYFVECQTCHRRSDQRSCEHEQHAVERWNKDHLEGADYDG